MKSKIVFLNISTVIIFWLTITTKTEANNNLDSNSSPLILKKLHEKLNPSLLSNKFIRDSFIPAYINLACENFNEIITNTTSPDCAGNMKTFFDRICNFSPADEDLWTLHMLDAWAKPPEGLLSGHINPMGDFDECVQIHAKNVQTDGQSEFKGRYCTVYLNISIPDNLTANEDSLARESVSPGELIELMKILQGIFVIPSIGTCFPDSCEVRDVNIIMHNLARLINRQLSLTGIQIGPLLDACYLQQKPPLDAGDISVLALIGTIAVLSIVAAIVDMQMQRARGDGKPKTLSLPMQYFMAFSLYTNTKKWLTTRSSGDDLGCLHGIRTISTTWVILAHTWYMVTFIPVWNMVDLKKVHENWAILTVLNSTISVDTFFVLSGLLVAYNVMKVLDKQNGRLNVPMFYIHRYLRLTPTYAILIGIMATIVPYLGTGPFWKIMDRWSNICEYNWWTNLLYVNNFVNTSMLCQGEAWYLANDMQFYILSPIVLFPLYKWPIFGILFLVLCTIGSILTPGLLVYFKETTPTTIGTRNIAVWFLDIYIKPWGRAQTYLVGIWIGYILYRYKGKKIEIPRFIQLIGWLLAIGTALSVLYGIYPYFDPLNEIPRIEGLFYASLNRFGWALSVSWVIFACCKGYGGLINSFLSWKVFIPLGRLCFCVFLVSLHLQMILHLSFRQAITFASYSMTNFFFAHLVISFIVGYFCTMLFESPFMKLEKLIFEGPDKPRSAIATTATPSGAGAGAGVGAGVGGAPRERYGIFYNNTETIINGIDAKSK